MSSHHIIRENQEGALIIANGEMCSTELLNSFLEWSPYILVLDGAYEKIKLRNINIDAVLGDFDSIDEQIKNDIYNEQNTELIYAPDQNKTDLEKGIDFLISKNISTATILWATGKRSDHFLNNFSSLVKYKNKILLTMFDDFSKIFLLQNEYEKWYKKGSILSLMPAGKVENISTSNLKYNLENETLEFGIRSGSSNEVMEDGFVKIKHKNGNLFLIESKD